MVVCERVFVWLCVRVFLCGCVVVCERVFVWLCVSVFLCGCVCACVVTTDTQNRRRLLYLDPSHRTAKRKPAECCVWS